MRTRTRTILAGLVLAAALVGGVAWATIPGTDGTIQGCYTTGNGNLRVVESADECRNSETAISWNQKGPAGATGAQGPTGATGPAGASGAAGANGVPGAQGAKGEKGDPGAKGEPGAAGTNGLDGRNGVDGTDGIDGAPGTNGTNGDTGPAGPAGGGGALASLDALGGIACNAAGIAGTIQVTYGPPPAGAVTLACKPTVTPTLTVTKTGAGAGIVTSSAGGISCGTTCSASYPYGTVVTLTHSSATDVFAGWSGACSGTGACVVTMDAAASVTANFVPGVTVTLNQSCAPWVGGDCNFWGGVVHTIIDPAQGVSCYFGYDEWNRQFYGTTCVTRFAAGTSIVLNSSRADVIWGLACERETGQTCSILLTSDRIVSAAYPAPPPPD